MPRIAPVSAASRTNESNADARGWANVLAGVPLFAELNRRHLNKVAALGRDPALPRPHNDRPHRRAGRRALRRPRRGGGGQTVWATRAFARHGQLLR